MSKPNHNIGGYTTQQAADIANISTGRVRQMVAAGEADHIYFGRSLVITELGMQQIKARKKKPGPVANGRKAA